MSAARQTLLFALLIISIVWLFNLFSQPIKRVDVFPSMKYEIASRRLRHRIQINVFEVNHRNIHILPRFGRVGFAFHDISQLPPIKNDEFSLQTFHEFPCAPGFGFPII